MPRAAGTECALCDFVALPYLGASTPHPGWQNRWAIDAVLVMDDDGYPALWLLMGSVYDRHGRWPLVSGADPARSTIAFLSLTALAPTRYDAINPGIADAVSAHLPKFVEGSFAVAA